MKDEEPIEGYFIVTSDNLIFEVKGVLHPDDRRIAYLRYVPTMNKSLRKRGNMYYIKIYNLLRREEFLQKNYPKYLWYDSTNDRILQSVRHEDVKEILSPVYKISSMQINDGHLTPIHRAAKELVYLLISKSGISSKHIGITGSILAGLTTPKSDIDIVIYGEINARRVFKSLQTDADLQSQIKRYTGTTLDDITRFRWGDCPDWKKLREIEKKKVLQGSFQSYPFYIRLVKYPHEIEGKYQDFSFRVIGRGRFLCKIYDDSDSILTPCVYKVDCKNDRRIVQIVSYRGRFTEQAKHGKLVRVEGTLETVHNHRTGERFRQVILGTDARDLLLPL